MSQKHEFQEGLFLVTTNAKGRAPWLTVPGVPEIIIHDLEFAKNLYGAKLYAFNVLPDHMHIIVNPWERGLSRFMQSFKTNSMLHIRRFFFSGEHVLSARGKYPICQDAPSAVEHNQQISGHGAFYTERKNTIRWQKGFDARIIEQEQTIEKALHYVHHNASHHHLVQSSADWPWSSLHFPELLDSMGW